MENSRINLITIWKDNGDDPVIFISKNVSEFANFAQKSVGVRECYVLSIRVTQTLQLLFCLADAFLQLIHELSRFCCEEILNVRFAFPIVHEDVAHFIKGTAKSNADRIPFVLMQLLNRCPFENLKVIFRMMEQKVKI